MSDENKKYTYRKITEQELIERLKLGEVEMWLNQYKKRIIARIIGNKCCIENYNVGNTDKDFIFESFGSASSNDVVVRYEVRKEVKEEPKPELKYRWRVKHGMYKLYITDSFYGRDDIYELHKKEDVIGIFGRGYTKQQLESSELIDD